MDRFRELLDAYGAEPRRWPAQERGMAEALIAASPEARALRAKAAGLDVMLDRVRPISPPLIDAEVLIGRIAAQDQGQGRDRGQVVSLQAGRRPAPSRFWLKVASLAAAAAIGFLLGASQLASIGDGPAPAAGPELADIAPW
jgi:hypothetical protein